MPRPILLLFNACTISGWQNILTVESPTATSCDLALANNTITIPSRSLVTCSATVGNNNGTSKFAHMRMLLDGAVQCKCTTRVFQSMGYSTLSLACVVEPGALVVQINGAAGANRNVMSSYHVCVHSV